MRKEIVRQEYDSPFSIDGKQIRIPWEQLFLDKTFSADYASWVWENLHDDLDFLVAFEREGHSYPALLTLTSIYDLGEKNIQPLYIRSESYRPDLTSAFVGTDPHKMAGKKVGMIIGSLTSGFMLARVSMILENFDASLTHVYALVDRRGEYPGRVDHRLDNMVITARWSDIDEAVSATEQIFSA